MVKFALLFVAVALAAESVEERAWPYASLKDKFRESGLVVHNALPYTDENAWIFYPFNNQLHPIFLVKYPNIVDTATGLRSEKVYAFEFTHFAEVQLSGSDYVVVPETTLSMSRDIEWIPNDDDQTPSWFYDDNLLEQVIVFSYIAVIENDKWDPVTDDDIYLTNATHSPFTATITIQVFPEASSPLDKMVDLLFHIEGYDSACTTACATTHLALFWKVTAPRGDLPTTEQGLGRTIFSWLQITTTNFTVYDIPDELTKRSEITAETRKLARPPMKPAKHGYYTKKEMANKKQKARAASENIKRWYDSPLTQDSLTIASKSGSILMVDGTTLPASTATTDINIAFSMLLNSPTAQP